MSIFVEVALVGDVGCRNIPEEYDVGNDESQNPIIKLMIDLLTFP